MIKETINCFEYATSDYIFLFNSNNNVFFFLGPKEKKVLNEKLTKSLAKEARSIRWRKTAHLTVDYHFKKFYMTKGKEKKREKKINENLGAKETPFERKTNSGEY